jgi:hypothetical protein
MTKPKKKPIEETAPDSPNEAAPVSTPAPAVETPPIAPNPPALALPATESAPAPVVETTSEKLVADLAASMPEPTGIPESNSAPVLNFPTAPAKPTGIKDSRNTIFDAKRHAVDDKGNPRLNKNGNFISNKVGRPAGSKSKNGEKVADLPDSEQPDAKIPVVELINNGAPDIYDQTAQMYLNVGFGIAASFLTNDIRPETPEENASMQVPLAAGLREKGEIPLSAWQLFAISVTAHVAKKFEKPTVKERFLLIVHRIRNFFSSPKRVN